MHLCKSCIFLDVDKEKECYWCIIKDMELTNYSNIETCNDRIVERKEFDYEKGHKI
jgi:hypothetical protein